MAKPEDLDPKPTGKVRAICEDLTGKEFVVEGNKIDLTGFGLEIELDTDVIVAIPGSQLRRVDIDRR